MAERSYNLRIQKTSRGYVVKAHSDATTRELVFDSWNGFVAVFGPHLDQKWMTELEATVEKSSYAVGVLPGNAVATAELVDSLGFPPELAKDIGAKNPGRVETCPDCQGARTMMGRNCLTCDGRGVVWTIS
jgi:hypothetical protein